MSRDICLLGFGEAAQTFCADPRWRARARGYDLKTSVETSRAAKLEDFRIAQVQAAESAAQAIDGAALVLSLVTADQSLAAARSAADHIAQDALYLDMNSVAPSTKQTAAKTLEPRGARYVDVAIMAPVQPGALATPLLISGPHADQALGALRAIGFVNVRNAGPEIGRASRIKMVRSVYIKGVEAVTAECMLAAHAGGVLDEVLESLGAGERAQANYRLERMLAHGLRRAAEMEECALALRDLGVEPDMTEGTIAWQRALGDLSLFPIPDSLEQKLARIRGAQTE